MMVSRHPRPGFRRRLVGGFADAVAVVTPAPQHPRLGFAAAGASRLLGTDTAVVEVSGVPFEIPTRDPYWGRLLARRFRYHVGLRSLLESARFSFDVIDVGANIGFWTVLVAGLHPAARITAVEPLPGLQALLRRNAARARTVAGANVDVIAAAVTAGATDTVELRVPHGRSGHVGASAAGGVWDGPGEVVAVRAISIGELIGRHRRRGTPLLVKLDVEGLEADILPSLLSHPEVAAGSHHGDVAVVIENHGRDVECRAPAAILAADGWRAYLLSTDPPRRIGSARQLAGWKGAHAPGCKVLAVRGDGPWAELVGGMSNDRAEAGAGRLG